MDFYYENITKSPLSVYLSQFLNYFICEAKNPKQLIGNIKMMSSENKKIDSFILIK